ncbi:MAG: hypothetical protein WA715_01660, partial [Candidatus Acidiferrum sp.]
QPRRTRTAPASNSPQTRPETSATPPQNFLRMALRLIEPIGNGWSQFHAEIILPSRSLAFNGLG